MFRAARVGFTLLELLVGIGVIAMLVVILLPSLSRAIEIARVTKCSNNLHVLSVAQFAYAGDHRGILTGSFDWADTANRPWYGYGDDPASILRVNTGLWPYVNNERAYLCPTMCSLMKSVIGMFNANILPSGAIPIRSYSMNHLLHNPPTGTGSINNMGMVQNTRFAMFAEENTWLIRGRATTTLNNPDWMPNGIWNREGVDSAGTYHCPPNILPNSPGNSGADGMRALIQSQPWGRLSFGSANISFLDGHVELIPYNYGNPEGILPNYTDIYKFKFP